MNKNIQQGAQGFNGLGIAPKILGILTELGYLVPTPIQLKSIPHSLERKDTEFGVKSCFLHSPIGFNRKEHQMSDTPYHKFREAAGRSVQKSKEIGVRLIKKFDQRNKQLEQPLKSEVPSLERSLGSGLVLCIHRFNVLLYFINRVPYRVLYGVPYIFIY
ncbi:MAG: hypothetical protein PF572_00600 [Patescibacteria group bacterium]|jgi:hypothetical protein|nr:hypothetical protein [Patescibacteria group bacterium]